MLDETLIVITADHAAQTGNPFFGVLAPGVTNPLCAARARRPRPASGRTATGTSATRTTPARTRSTSTQPGRRGAA